MILVMIWILNRTFFRPINRVLEAREKNKGGAGERSGDRYCNDVAEKQAKYNQRCSRPEHGYEMIEKEPFRRRFPSVRQRSRRRKTRPHRQLPARRNNFRTRPTEARAAIARDAEEMADKMRRTFCKFKPFVRRLRTNRLPKAAKSLFYVRFIYSFADPAAEGGGLRSF